MATMITYFSSKPSCRCASDRDVPCRASTRTLSTTSSDSWLSTSSAPAVATRSGCSSSGDEGVLQHLWLMLHCTSKSLWQQTLNAMQDNTTACADRRLLMWTIFCLVCKPADMWLGYQPHHTESDAPVAESLGSSSDEGHPDLLAASSWHRVR